MACIVEIAPTFTFHCDGTVTLGILNSGVRNSTVWSTGETTSSIVVNAIGEYTIIGNYTICDNTITLSLSFNVTQLPNTSTIPNTLTVCSSDPRVNLLTYINTLNGGDSIVGNGVENNIFYPNQVTIGNTIITYSLLGKLFIHAEYSSVLNPISVEEDFNCTKTLIITVNNCNAYKAIIKPGFITKCSPERVIKANLDFANAIYQQMVKYRYGIQICCEEHLQNIIIEKERIDFFEL